jgi:hypothetical protein
MLLLLQPLTFCRYRHTAFTIHYLQKYIAPLLRTPTAADLERDKKAIADQYTSAADRLDAVRADTQFVRKEVEDNSASVRESLTALASTLEELRANDGKRDIDVSSLREQVDAIRDMIPKVSGKSMPSCSYDSKHELTRIHYVRHFAPDLILDVPLRHALFRIPQVS